jgi:hypothetical protein
LAQKELGQNENHQQENDDEEQGRQRIDKAGPDERGTVIAA